MINMYRKIRYIVSMCVLLCLLLSGCGGYSSTYSDSMRGYENGMTEEMSSSESISYYNNPDYSSVSLKGNYIDYSYVMSAKGYPTSKSTPLSFYEDVVAFIDELDDGYISNVSNTHNMYDIDDFSYLSDYEIKYSARGNVRFVAHVEQKYAQDIIDMFDEFCKKNDFAVITYNQYIENYEHVKVIDERNEDNYYDYRSYTKDEIEDILKYTDLSFNISYSIVRPKMEASMLRMQSIFSELFDFGKDGLLVVFWAVVFAWISMCCIIIPIKKYNKKSMYKYLQKHPEYNLPTNVVLCRDKDDNYVNGYVDKSDSPKENMESNSEVLNG